MKKVGQLSGHKGEILSIAAQEKLVVTGAEDGASIWSVADQKKVTALGGAYDGDEVVSVTFVPSDPNTVFSAASKFIWAHDLRNPDTPLEKLELNRDDINQIAVNNDGTFLAAADDTGRIRVIDVKTRKSYKTLSRWHDNICNTVQFRPRGKWTLLSGGLDSKIVLWDFSRPRKIWSVSTNDNTETTETSTQLCNPPLVNSVSFSATGNTVAAGLGDCSVALYGIGKKGRMWQRARLVTNGHTAGIGQVHFPSFDNQNTLLSGGNDAKICLWDLTKHNESDNEEMSKIDTPVTATTHGRKINWLTTSQNSVFVADTSKVVTVYEVV
eukprot:m.131448 g.131448  ORF g.131448 m.131448 type:complete len:326 (-) comp29548_c0_seq1:140-1117(-)